MTLMVWSFQTVRVFSYQKSACSHLAVVFEDSKSREKPYFKGI